MTDTTEELFTDVAQAELLVTDPGNVTVLPLAFSFLCWMCTLSGTLSFVYSVAQ